MPSAEDEKALKEVFDLYDADNSGAIDSAELGTLLRYLGLCPTNAMVHALLKQYDKDAGGTLDFAEFKALAAEAMPESSTAGLLRSAFAAFDTDGSGSISIEELRHALTTMGEPLSDAEVDALFRVVDSDGSGTVDYAEFAAAMSSGLPVARLLH